MSTVEIASLMTTASFIQKFGFTAASAGGDEAGHRPGQRPGPAAPMATIATVPITTIVSRWARTLSANSRDVGPSTRTVSGGWSAAGRPLNGLMNQLPLARLWATRL